MTKTKKTTVNRHTYTDVVVWEKNRVYVAAVADELEDEGLSHAIIFRRRDDEWAYNPVEGSVVSTCLLDKPNLMVLNCGVGGEIYLFTVDGQKLERVDDSDEGPSSLLQLRCIRTIGKHVYAAGLGRHVYKRFGDDDWHAIDQGVFLPRARRQTPVGFNCIGGILEHEIYAAGYLGEIWFYDGKKWHQEKSPTNVSLNAIKCVGEAQVYIVGMAGVLIRGFHGSWEIIDHDATKGDFWGVTWFQERLFVANYEGVFVLEGENLSRVDMGLGKRFTTAYLDARDGVMWSVGEKDIAYTEDGSTWVKVERTK